VIYYHEPGFTLTGLGRGPARAYRLRRFFVGSLIAAMPKSVRPGMPSGGHRQLDFTRTQNDVVKINVLDTRKRSGPDPESLRLENVPSE
jgi:hypothetical protein